MDVVLNFIIILTAGFAAGLLGGMGMGGGTALIPILTLAAGVEQHVAQAANLIAFLPMAALSLNVHKKSGLVGSKGVAAAVLSAVLTSVAGGFAAAALPGAYLKKLFGVFLIVLGIRGLFSLKTSAFK